jgi:hypothetical protein
MSDFIRNFKWAFAPIFALVFFMLLIMGWEVLKFIAFVFEIKIRKK